ncbi:E3 ubiquitin-protein ligase CCNB1IP1 [Smittium culicis]|uniref:E3 ubiquitin-protein ligase CCNB1IP1 n=1 Tax=Smittium culicis TaxID=133412 RepID=A0A1R1XZR5_9FUNG|nr:E3 ubiquitin-protein ligase CCNB1IP1 [Smittium culicis]
MVLAGQGPEVIMEVASRALAFWVYQISQEISFQDILTKRIDAKSKKIEAKATTIIKDWQAKNKLLKESMVSLQSDFESEKKKSYNLGQQLQEKISS